MVVAQTDRSGRVAEDTDLLYGNIRRNPADSDVFVRKAIGWALRTHFIVEPAAVIRFVRDHAADLSGLSKREGLKRVIKAGLIDSVP